jgi:ZIP family zinc transporter
MVPLAVGHANPSLVGVGGLLIGLATVAGAELGRRHAARRELCLGAAAGALLVIAGVHLLPDAWQAARQAGTPAWVVPAAAVTAFAVAGAAVRRGCACQAGKETAGGTGTAAALAAHRLLEGAALALVSSVAVAVGLTVHAFAEGLATGTLLRSAKRRQRALWLTAMCASPLAGAALAGFWPFPEDARPVLLAIAAGVLAQAARVSLAAAFREPRLIRLAFAPPAVATLIAAAITTFAVRAVG